MKGFRNFWVLSACLLLAVPVFVFAQTTGDIQGTVSDTDGKPLPGVTVEATSTALQGARIATTAADGKFRFPALPVGTYRVRASLAGFATVDKTASVALGATITANLTMQVSAKEEIVVTGEAPVIDTTKTVIGTSTKAEEISKLPLGRSYSDIATRAPGTGTDAAGGVTVYGATSLENEYVIDGVNTSAIKGMNLGNRILDGNGNQGKELNKAFVQEVEVKTGGYEAEYGRALGGVINVVTKSGGNEFHGDVFGSYDNKSIAAKDAHVAEKADVGLSEFIPPKRVDFGLDVGGYFVKDYVWFFGAYDRLNTDLDFNRLVTDRAADDSRLDTPVTEAGSTKTRANLFSAKLTLRAGAANTFVLTAFGDPGHRDNEDQQIIGPASADLATRKTGSTDAAAKYNGVFGSNFLAEAQFGFHREKNDVGGQEPGANDTFSIRKIQPGFLTEWLPGSGYAGLVTKEQYSRYDYRGTGTAFVGNHEFKAGADFERINSDFDQAFAGDGQVRLRFRANGTQRQTYQRFYMAYPPTLNCVTRTDMPGNFVGTYTPVVGPDNVCAEPLVATSFSNPDTRNLALFAQDSWKILRNLTLNAGIRWEDEKLKNYAGDTVIHFKNEWSPRAGLVWDPLNNGTSKVFASYGRFYTTVPQDIQTRSLGREAQVILFNNSNVFDPVSRDRDGNLTPAVFIQTGDAIGPDLKGMYQDEIIAGVEYEVIKNWAVGVKGIYKSLGRTVEDRCDLAANPDVVSFGPTSTDPTTRILAPTCAVINPGGDGTLNTIKDPLDKTCYPNGAVDENGNIVPSSPCKGISVSRFYRAIELDVTHRFAENFFVQSSYIYSRLNGNYSGNLSQTREGGQFDPNINADFDYPGLVPNAYGLLRNDRTHQFKLTGFYSFPFGLTTGLNFTLASGRPYSIRGCALDVFACNSGYDQEGYLLPRGSAGRLPTVYEADLHIEYALNLGPVSIRPYLDIFNLLNQQKEISREELFNNQAFLEGNDPHYWVGQLPNCTQAQADKGFTPECSPNPTFGKAIAWQAPRFLRIGARVSF